MEDAQTRRMGAQSISLHLPTYIPIHPTYVIPWRHTVGRCRYIAHSRAAPPPVGCIFHTSTCTHWHERSRPTYICLEYSTMTESPRDSRPGPGGFLLSQPSLPSPTPSTASSRVAALLPHPRSKPLVPGSKKEDYARDYVARRLLHISRRYVKKFGIPDPADEVAGYESMEEVCRDLEEVEDV